MPDLYGAFRFHTDEAMALTKAIEQIKIGASSDHKNLLSTYRLQLIYELAYLRIFAHWEEFIEETFLRYMCGYECSLGPEKPLLKFEHTISDAEKLILGGHQYVLWHSPAKIISRSKTYFDNGKHEIIIGSNISRLEQFSFIRHRIAHHQRDAKVKFDTAWMSLCGKRFPGSRPGAFLRDWVTISGIKKRWLNTIADELCNMAHQITP